MDIRDLITIDNDILGGQTVFKGTRVPVESLFDHLEAGVSLDDFLEDFPNRNENTKKRILSEAHFLRAMAYFNLVRGWGPVPIKTQESVDLSAIASPREPEAKVYEPIIADAPASEKDLPESVGDQTGRASKYAAKMLLAQVYLTLEKWSDAATKANEVIAKTRYALVPAKTQKDFYNIFATVTNTEDIMSVHHSDTRQSAIPTYESRPNTPPYNYSSGGNYAWLPNLKSFIGPSWDDRDFRKSFNLYYKYIGPNGDSVALPAATPALFKKFITTPNGLSSYSVPIYRYTEAFLIYAEASCMAEGTPSVLALERLNKIKRRACGYDQSPVSPVDYPAGMTKDNFRDAVLKERGYEFILEGHRWWDLKRTGRVKSAFQAISKSFIDARLLWPIPQDEINNNPAITQANQNPGY